MNTPLAIAGERISGDDVRHQNGKRCVEGDGMCATTPPFRTPSCPPRACLAPVLAAMAVANVVKSSLGPVGLDKMLVDDVGVR
jgi:hypothetical protein